MVYAESKIQMEIVNCLQQMGVFFFAVPNERKQSPRSGARMKSMGVRSGVADIIIMGEKGRGFCLEVKSATGRQSETQKAFQAKCVLLDWPYALVRSVEDVRRVGQLWGLFS